MHLHCLNVLTTYFSVDLCDFEDGSCNWQQHTDDDFDWVRHSGHTDNPNTGPDSDHTTNTPMGHYYYLPSSDTDKTGQKAVMSSPLYPAGESLQHHYSNIYRLVCLCCGGFSLWHISEEIPYKVFSLLQTKAPVCSCGTTCMVKEWGRSMFTSRAKMEKKLWFSHRQETRADCGGSLRLHFCPEFSLSEWVRNGI